MRPLNRSGWTWRVYWRSVHAAERLQHAIGRGCWHASDACLWTAKRLGRTAKALDRAGEYLIFGQTSEPDRRAPAASRPAEGLGPAIETRGHGPTFRVLAADTADAIQRLIRGAQ